MANIEDAANILLPVLDPQQPDSITHLLEAVGRRVQYEQELVVQATEGSDAPETQALHGALAQIASGIGELAAATAFAADAKEALLAKWGIASTGATGVQPTSRNTPQPKEYSERERPKMSLDTPLGEDIQDVGPVKLAQLKCRGVRTYRDVLVAGTHYITNTSKVGSHVANVIAKHIAEVTDETVQDTAEFADTVRICTTLNDVSWAALHSTMTAEMAMLLGWRHRRVSIHDLITQPRDALVTFNTHDHQQTEMKRALNEYDRLVRDARDFADKFKKAKGQQ